MTRLVYLKLLLRLCGRWLGERRGPREGLSVVASGGQMREVLNRMEAVETEGNRRERYLGSESTGQGGGLHAGKGKHPTGLPDTHPG